MSTRIKHFLEAGLVLLIILFLFCIPPAQFPVGDIFVIKKGQTTAEIAENLKKNHYIQSTFVFKGFTFLFGNSLKSGSYEFDNTSTLFEVAWRLSRADFRIQPIKIVFQEGETIAELRAELKQRLKFFDEKKFDELTKDKEGYLFPETYHVLPDEDGEALVRTMQETFTDKIKTLETKIKASGKPLKDVITMASIIEKEARVFETRKIVSGILWKRIRNGMPLQVDVTLAYVTGRTTFALTKADLASQNLYNTYKHKGLPPGPIANPGLSAIEAAVTPIDTPYWFFLTGRDGVMYYGKTFEEHVANRKHL